MRSLEKFQRTRRPALAALSAAMVLASSPAQAAEVIALGDTWSSGAASALQTSLGAASLGYTVADWGSPAGTAEFYATTGTASITAALAANPDAQWVWLSVGFDDLVNRYPAESGNQIAAANDANLRTILNSIFAAAPQVRVVMFAYDYPNYVQTPACQTQLATDFGVSATQLDVNSLMITTIGASMQAVADSYAQATYVPLFGTLQVAGGASADSTLPSPATHMADCTHPNATGYAALTDALVATYWQAALPTSVASASATTICSGDIVTFTSLSTQNQGQVWRLQGTVTSTQPTWMAAISGTGTATVTLEAYNFAWTDTSTVNLTLNNCSDAGVPDTGAMDTGAIMDAGMIDSGVVDAAPDAAVDAGFPDAAPDAAVDAGFPDAAPDAAVDAGFPDAAPDAAVDAGFPDAAPDAAVDAGFPDAAPDAAVDAGFPDAAPDAAVDAGFPDAAPDAAVDAGFPDAAPDAAVDAGFPDAAPDAAVDAGFPDAAPDAEVDAGFPDAGFPDAEVDAGFPDAEVDAGFPDAEVDAGFPDAEVDAGFPDAEVDAGFPDAEVDAGFPDAEVDAGFPDAEVDAGFPDAEVDSGVVEPDAGSPDTGVAAVDAGANVFDDINITGNGCSCETDRAASAERGLNPWALAGLFAMLLLRRRRR